MRQILWERGLYKDGMNAARCQEVLAECEDFRTEMTKLEKMVADGYATIERTLEVPADCAPPLPPGRSLPADPAPFNHPTKIAMVRLRRKDGKSA